MNITPTMTLEKLIEDVQGLRAIAPDLSAHWHCMNITAACSGAFLGKSRRANMRKFDSRHDCDMAGIGTRSYIKHVKGSFEDWMAEIVVRIAEAAVSLGVNAVDKDAKDPFSYQVEQRARPLPADLETLLSRYVVASIIEFAAAQASGRTIAGLLVNSPICSVDLWCKMSGIDLYRHIELVVSNRGKV